MPKIQLFGGEGLAAPVSVVGGIVLALLVVVQLWSSFSSEVLTAVGVQRRCNDTENGPFVYFLNPKYGSNFQGADRPYWNQSGRNTDTCTGRRRRLTGQDPKENESQAVKTGSEEPRHLRKLFERDIKRHRSKDSVWDGGDCGPATRGKALPIFGKVYPDGLYYIAVGVGDPPRPFYLDIDTGSDLTWLTCDAPCVNCAKGPNDWYNPNRARLVDCAEPLCNAAQIGHIHGCALNPVDRQCDYDVQYGDGSASQGVLVSDTLAFLHPDGRLLPAPIAFGCAYDQEGQLAHSPSMTDGILGLGSGPISLPSQLSTQGLVSNMVGHCIASGPIAAGYLFLGDTLVPPGMTWTPMLGKPAAEYYYLALTSLRYGSRMVEVEESVFHPQNGGVIVDSGSSFTYLVEPAFKALLAVIRDEVAGTLLKEDGLDPVLPHCWRGPHAFRSVEEVSYWFSPIELTFKRGPLQFLGTTLDLSIDGYLVINAAGNVCLGILDSGVVTPGGATTIIGDVSLRGYLVVYDNVHHTVGWTRRNCMMALQS